MHTRKMLRGLALAALALSVSIFAAQAYSPYDSVSVTSHYDANGNLVGVEAFGPCGFSLYGSTGAYSQSEVITCGELDQVELPY